METEFKTKLKKEIKLIGLLFVIILVVFKVIFYKESLLVILKTVSSLFWLFVLPGFVLLYYWHQELSFAERLIIGSVLGVAITTIVSYNLGLFGLHVKYHAVLLPAIFLILSTIMILKRYVFKEDFP